MDIFHVLNRGVDKRNIFLDDRDHARFVHDLFEMNDAQPAGSIYYSFAKYLDLRSPDIESAQKRRRQLLVDIHGWVLMKNHYHLLLSERIEGGLTLFIRKLNIGYAKYFNERYNRVGTLFQSRTKKILIERDQQFNYILHYIHLNPLDYLKGAEQWRIRSKGALKSSKQALKYLKEYRWSSYLDYIDEKNFPSILTKDFFGDAFGNYQKTLAGYLKDAESETPLLALE